MKKETINFTLQGKGGVGKSFITTILAQYFKDYKGININGADTDPVNMSFSGFKSLGITPLDIINKGDISQEKFDLAFELMLENKETFIIDNGASTFLPLTKYIYDNDVISIFDEENRDVFFHTVIVGGQSLYDTLKGLNTLFDLIKDSKSTKLVIWLNEFQGEIPLNQKDVKEIFEIVSKKTAGFVLVRDRNSDAFTHDVKKLMSARLTLKEALLSGEFNLMAKSRLKRVFDEIYDQLDKIYDKPQEKNEKSDENSK